MRLQPVFLLIVCALLLASCGESPATITPVPTAPPPPTATTSAVPTPLSSPTAAVTPTPGSLSNEELVDKLRPSTVFVLGKFAETAIQAEGQGSGTGIVYDTQNGYILTAAHVIEGAASLKIYPANSTKARPVRVVGRAPCEDLAVLKVDDTSGLVAAQLGNSDAMKVGADVVALGYPTSLGNGNDLSVNPGTISKKDVTAPPYASLIQTSAVLAPGNSGGPLVNRHGEVIGVNVLSLSIQGQGAVSYYAIAMSHAKPIVKELELGKNPNYIGLNLHTNGYKDYFGTLNGVAIIGVQEGSPGSLAGLQPADLLLKLGGVSVNNDGDVCDILSSHSDGDKLGVVVLRGAANAQQQQCSGELTIGKGSKSVLTCTPLGGGGGSTGGGATGSGTKSGGGTANCQDQAHWAILVCNDFNDNTAGPWPTVSNDQGVETVVNGEYSVLVQTANLVDHPVPTSGAVSDLADGAVEAYFKMEGTGDAGIMARRTSGKDFYACWIDNNKQFGCYRWDNGKETPIIKTAHSELIKPGDYNDLIMSMLGTTLYLTINQQDVASIDDTRLASGEWGVLAETSGSSTHFKASFDLIRIFAHK